jgi:hypothetical protein
VAFDPLAPPTADVPPDPAWPPEAFVSLELIWPAACDVPPEPAWLLTVLVG